MNEIEMPPPAPPPAAAAAPAELARGGDPEAGAVAREGASDSGGGRRASGCRSYLRDMKHSLSGCSSDFRNNTADADLGMQERMLPDLKRKCDMYHLEDTDEPLPLSPKHEGKLLNMKSSKKFGILPASKVQRVDQTENAMKTYEDDNIPVQSRHISPEDSKLRSTNPEKPHAAKTKRCHDGRRSDKKRIRATIRAKNDSFTSNAGLTMVDSAFRGSTTLGIDGLITDLCKFTKHVDEVSLNELLDISFKCSKICTEKGKKAQNSKGSILLSVRKAYSVLPPQRAVDINVTEMTSTFPNPCSFSTSICDSDGTDICIEDSAPCQKGNVRDSNIYEPKVILEKLAITSAGSLDELLSISNGPLPTQSAAVVKASRNASLQPFGWSSSQNGFSKAIIDSSKLPSIKSTCQSKWARIGTNFCSKASDYKTVEELNIFVGKDSMNQQQIDTILQEIKAFTVPNKPSFDEPFRTSHAKDTIYQVEKRDDIISGKDLTTFASSTSRKLNFLDDVDSVCKDSLGYVNSKVDLGCEGDELISSDIPTLNLCSSNNEVTETEPAASNTGGPGNCHSYPFENNAGRGPNSRQLEPWYPPTTLIAAEILRQMKNSSSTEAQNIDFGSIKWLKAPSQKTMKARKSTPSVEKTNMPVESSPCPVKSKSLSSAKHKLGENKNDFTHTSSSFKEPVRWPSSAENDSSPIRLEKDLNVQSRLSHGNFVRPSVAIHSPTRNENGYDGQQLRMGTPKTSSPGFGGTFVKDWGKGKGKRM